MLLRTDGEARERSRRELTSPWPPSGGDTRRRAAPLSNPRPAQPAPLIIWPIARRNKLEPQPPAGGRRAHARASALLAAALRACVRRVARPPPAARPNRGRASQRSWRRRATGGAGLQHDAQPQPPAQHAVRAAGRAAARRAEQRRTARSHPQPRAAGRRAHPNPTGRHRGWHGSSSRTRRRASCRPPWPPRWTPADGAARRSGAMERRTPPQPPPHRRRRGAAGCHPPDDDERRQPVARCAATPSGAASGRRGRRRGAARRSAQAGGPGGITPGAHTPATGCASYHDCR